MIADAWSPAGERPASPSSSFFSGETDEDEDGIDGEREKQEAETPEGGASPVVVLGGLEGEGEGGKEMGVQVQVGRERTVKKVGSRREGFF